MGIYLRGQTWWMRYTPPNGARVRESTNTPNKSLARMIYAKRLVSVAENRHLDIKRESGCRFRDFSLEFFERYSRPNKRSWKSADAVSIKNLDAFFGDTLLSRISQQKIEEYMAHRRSTVLKRPSDGKERNLAPATVNRELSCLKTMFKKAVEWGKLTVNPCANVRKLKEDNKRTRFLTVEEMELLLKASFPKLRQAIIVLLHTGVRKGELQRLSWSDIDFDRNLIALYQTKNGKARYIPMNEAVKSVLLQRRINKESLLLVFPGSADPNKLWDFSTAFKGARKRANLQDVRIHDLRHTFASHLCMKGADLMTVKELLGHSSLEMTQRYSHLTDRHKAEAVARLDSIPIQFGTILAHSEEAEDKKEFEKIVSPLESLR